MLPIDHDQAQAACDRAVALYRMHARADQTDHPDPMLFAFRFRQGVGVVAKGIMLPGLSWRLGTPANILRLIAEQAERFGRDGFLMVGATANEPMVGMGVVVQGRHPTERNYQQLYAHLALADACYGYAVGYIDGEEPVPMEDQPSDDDDLADALAQLTHALGRDQNTGQLN